MSQPPRPRARIWRRSRWLRPSMFLAVLIFFAFPFLTVGCLPANFGHVSAGGTTAYTGYDLALGLAPSRAKDHLLPTGQRSADLLGVHPLLIIAVVLVLAGLAAGIWIQVVSVRRVASAAAAGLAALFVPVGAGLARSSLIGLVEGQTATVNLGEGKSAASFVSYDKGYLLSLTALVVVAVVDIGLVVGALWRSRR